MAWQFHPSEAVFIQIADRLRREILAGHYPPGSQFPPVRRLATDAAVNPNTMQKALVLLEEEGVLYSKGTIGRFVTDEEDVLQRMREHIRCACVRRWVAEAAELGIDKETLIQYIQKEEA